PLSRLAADHEAVAQVDLVESAQAAEARVPPARLEIGGQPPESSGDGGGVELGEGRDAPSNLEIEIPG
ncbi:MAG TPA: hypothetical protein VGW35_19750, partial [Methylomirabilota bacterium]|nr:hypothetical protein [Methylomirabilota bacterium]